MTAFIPKTDLEWVLKICDVVEEDDCDCELSGEAERRLESIVRQIREEAIRAHGNGEGA